MLPRSQISKTADQRIIIISIREFLYHDHDRGAYHRYLQHHQPRRHSNSSRGSGIIDPASATAMARGASASSTPAPPYQRLEGLRHHRLRFHHSNGSRESGIIDSGSTIAMAREALASSTPPLLHQRLEGLWHHRPCLRCNNSLRSCAITFALQENVESTMAKAVVDKG
jgi:hypothetical protein